MFRTHTCGDLRLDHANQTVTLAGWVQTVRDKGGVLWIDLRDRYGITQLLLEDGRVSSESFLTARSLGREFVLQAEGTVIERKSKNPNLPTGDVEILVTALTVLNPAKLPPFLIEDQTDGGDDLRMRYRYLDLRRNPIRANMQLRHKVAQQTRFYLDNQDFIEVETPVLIKSTPEGARDFVVPSRMNPGEFYALPQSPQTFKQLLMVSGFDKYYQIVKCFRDEDLRADRQPEFTQIDCEMSFVEQEDILTMFEGLVRHLFKTVKNLDFPTVPRMTYAEAMRRFGSDKPDTRFGMEFCELKTPPQPLPHREGLSVESDSPPYGGGVGGGVNLTADRNFLVFDAAELVVGICAKGCADYTRKQLDELTEWVKRPQIGAKGLIYARVNPDGSVKSSVDKFYSPDDLAAWAVRFGAEPGDLLLILAGDAAKTRKQLNELRLDMGNRMGLRKPDEFSPLWVLDFPLLEYGEDETDPAGGRWYAMHHPFTSPKPEDIPLLDTDPGAVRANAYDLVINGTEVGGGSIRIFQRDLQARMFGLLGFSPDEAQAQFGFLMDAFEFGAPPHGGLAFGFDRLCAIFGGADSIRDFIAFPKNNAGRDVMIDSPSAISQKQLDELKIRSVVSQ